MNLTTKQALQSVSLWLWLRQNYGVLTRIAEDLDISVQSVHQAFWGKRRSKRVETALRAAGAPLPENGHKTTRGKASRKQ